MRRRKKKKVFLDAPLVVGWRRPPSRVLPPTREITLKTNFFLSICKNAEIISSLQSRSSRSLVPAVIRFRVKREKSFRERAKYFGCLYCNVCININIPYPKVGFGGRSQREEDEIILIKEIVGRKLYPEEWMCLCFWYVMLLVIPPKIAKHLWHSIMSHTTRANSKLSSAWACVCVGVAETFSE